MDKCPPFNDFFLPLMKMAHGEEVQIRDCAERIADQFGLSSEARLETTASGSKARYVDRTHWAATYLRQAGLLTPTRRGYVTVSPSGQEFLLNVSDKITRDDLKKIPAFQDFESRTGKRALKKNKVEDRSVSSLTPMDSVSEALEEIEAALVSEIIDSLIDGHPSFFEKAVIDLLMAMGYGGQNKDAGRVTGKSGDNGIDGVIDQDQLGLDRVYVQAKRYNTGNSVSAEAVRGFTGALAVHQASKGLFFTTSSFTKGAEETAERVGQRVVLIDGQRLAKLMIVYGVGCTTKKTISIMQIDRDYFE